MAQGKDTTNLSGMLFQFMGMNDPMLSMLERLNILSIWPAFSYSLFDYSAVLLLKHILISIISKPA